MEPYSNLKGLNYDGSKVENIVGTSCAKEPEAPAQKSQLGLEENIAHSQSTIIKLVVVVKMEKDFWRE